MIAVIDNKGNTVRCHAVQILVPVLAALLSLATVAIAAPKVATDVVGDLASRGVVADQGYGPYRWGDAPVAAETTSCITYEDPAGVPIHSECTSSTDLPPIGIMPVIAAKWLFEYGRLSSYTLNVEIDEANRQELPDRLEIKVGGVSVTFQRNDKRQAVLTVGNLDYRGFRSIVSDSSQGINASSTEDMADFISKLGSLCPDCRQVLTDYLVVVGEQDRATPDMAIKLLTESPTIAYLMAARTLDGPSKPISLYQLALDKIASWQSALRSVPSETVSP